MKKAGIVIAAVLCVALVCGGFFLLKTRADSSKEGELSEVQKIITRDLELKYPVSPREVIKYYNRIITVYYKQEYTDKELDALADHALALFDDELAANNPKDAYLKQVRAEVDNYAKRKRSISQASVCDSRDVVFLTDPDKGDDLAYVTATYFIRENNSYDRTYQKYVLRKDEQGRWKILTYYQVSAGSSEDDGDD